jgi:HNH endonuclease
MAHETMTREWRVVQDFPDYEVSNDGLVRRRVASSSPRGPTIKAGFIYKPLGRAGAYLYVSLVNGKTRKNVSIHVLVATAFIGARPPGLLVAHWDRNRHNNRASNLRWATQKENLSDRERHGTVLRGTKHHQAKLTEADVLAIRAARKESGASFPVLGSRFGISASTAQRICSGRTWGHLA